MSIDLQQKAATWVSVFVLVGCIAITGVLVFAAHQAEVFGHYISEHDLDAFNSGSI